MKFSQLLLAILSNTIEEEKTQEREHYVLPSSKRGKISYFVFSSILIDVNSLESTEIKTSERVIFWIVKVHNCYLETQFF